MFNIEYDILEELNIGDTQLRLIQNISNKKKAIQLYSSLSSQWNVTHRYDVENQWQTWKKTAENIARRKT
jgi:hypothetical protein